MKNTRKWMLLFFTGVLAFGLLGCRIGEGGPAETPPQDVQTTEAPSAAPQQTDAPRDTAEPTPAFSLTEQQKTTLKKLCYTIPTFSGEEDMDDAFMRYLLFYVYTGGWETAGTREESGTLYVEDASAQEMIRLLVGVEYDVTRLVYQEDASYCYEQDGNIVVMMSDYGDIEFVYQDMVEQENGYAVHFDMIPGGEEQSMGVHTIVIEPADNQNGFLVRGAAVQLAE